MSDEWRARDAAGKIEAIQCATRPILRVRTWFGETKAVTSDEWRVASEKREGAGKSRPGRDAQTERPFVALLLRISILVGC